MQGGTGLLLVLLAAIVLIVVLIGEGSGARFSGPDGGSVLWWGIKAGMPLADIAGPSRRAWAARWAFWRRSSAWAASWAKGAGGVRRGRAHCPDPAEHAGQAARLLGHDAGRFHRWIPSSSRSAVLLIPR